MRCLIPHAGAGLLALSLLAGTTPLVRAQDKAQPATPATPSAPATAAPTAPATPATAPAGATAPPVAAKPEAQDTAGTPATVIDDSQIESVLGRSVQSPKGDDMGRIVDVLVDRTGAVRAAVIDFGGFFGVGSRKIAVAWNSLHFKSEGKTDTVIADLPRNQLKMAPVYKENEPVVVIGLAGTKANEPAAGAPPASQPAAQ